ncbi:hypothetical protein [Streptosporangium carneum]|uniref:Peptidase n=1 Tax=Streptosporangium carneum TaxID=47481 RepID=A0A9W6I8S1_9ACTN|nr:hypothetical protein [Streptosporangium carneum]GLK14132.1 hypothetical protein GCM10017600_75440 [Streptosporangium carneum]
MPDRPPHPPCRAVRAALLTALLLAFVAAPAAVAAGAATAGGPGGEPARPAGRSILGIRLLEIPANRMNDPRSHAFIVDHVNPGTTFTRRLEIHNASSRPQHVELYAAGASVKDGGFVFDPGRTANELSSWITLDRSALDLPGRSRVPVKATVAVPAWATKAERYAVIWAELSSPAPGPQGNIALVHRVGIRAYLDIGPGGEPPSDFEIGQIIPQRTEDGQPKIIAAVANTGQRALDLEGQVSLSEGPSSMSAGPFSTEHATTLAPGDHTDVAVLLGDDLPDGPWKFHLTLHSGRIERTATGTLTFPTRPGTWGLPAALSSPLGASLSLAALIAFVAALALLIGFRRSRARRVPTAP